MTVHLMIRIQSQVKRPHCVMINFNNYFADLGDLVLKRFDVLIAQKHTQK